MVVSSNGEGGNTNNNSSSTILIKTVKQKEINYYKYAWSSSKLFTPTGKIVASDGWTNVQNAFDDNFDTYASCGTATDYIDIVLDTPIKITGAEAYDGARSSVSRAMGIRLYNVVNGVESLIVDMKTPSGSGGTYSNYYSTTFSEIQTSHIRIKLSETNTQGNPPTTQYPSRLRKVKLTGKTSTVTQGTSSDYDYYVDNSTYKSPKYTVRKYYKYRRFETLPTFSSAAEASAGKEGITFNPTDIYPVINNSVAGTITNSLGVYYTFNFDKPVRIDSFTYQARVVPNARPAAYLDRFEVFVDGTWKSLWTGRISTTKITTNVSNSYRSTAYRIYLVGFDLASYGGMGVQYFNMTGYKVQESTSSDYDFYIDEPVYYGLNI